MDRKRILVVEDDAAIRRGLVDALSFAGYATLEASEGAAGLAAALESDCDLLFAGPGACPGRDGLAILRELRALQSPLPVIVLTARGSEDDRVRGLAPGRRRLRRQAVQHQGAARPDRGRPEAGARAASGGPAARFRGRAGRPRAARGRVR